MSKVSMVMDKASEKRFYRNLESFTKKGGKLKPAFQSIGSHWFKGNNRQFSLRPGQYADLTQTYKEWKKKKFGSEYPILVLRGGLKKSMTVSGDPNAVFKVDDMGVTLGTKILTKKGKPYPVFIHKEYKSRGGGKVPARPLYIKSKDDIDAWTRILWRLLIKIKRSVYGR